ncbi:HyaD/HybD family hydrogenase maturation endopeptidase [Crenobacter caeni]|nr:HyaD/HybD family hydrogenase maturation endopeptidase [Crenobacter caeni]
MGLGNLLWADEGFGVRAAELVYARYAWPNSVEVIDGGTQGLLLLPYVEAASHLILLDAIDFGLEPGTLRVFDNDAVPAYLTAKKMSLHQTGFSEVLGLASLQGRMPAQLKLIGVQPAVLEDYGGSLSAPVRGRLEEAVALAVATLKDWGVPLTPRTDGDTLNDASLSLSAYENGRPSAEMACRIGDARVLEGQG